MYKKTYHVMLLCMFCLTLSACARQHFGYQLIPENYYHDSYDIDVNVKPIKHVQESFTNTSILSIPQKDANQIIRDIINKEKNEDTYITNLAITVDNRSFDLLVNLFLWWPEYTVEFDVLEVTVKS